jgi:hypothetical protein
MVQILHTVANFKTNLFFVCRYKTLLCVLTDVISVSMKCLLPLEMFDVLPYREVGRMGSA